MQMKMLSPSKAIKAGPWPSLKWVKGTAIAFSIALWSSPTFALPVHVLLNKSAPYTPPPDAGTPVPTGGTGSRGGCAEVRNRPPLAALVGQPHLLRTTSDRPVFWIYVPYTPEEAPSGLLSLQQGDDAIYETTFNLAATPGVVGIALPESAPALVAGQEYDWFIDINCVAAVGARTPINGNTNNSPGSLDGLVQRVPVSTALANDLSQATTGLEVVAAYGRHHIWYDWLTELARLRLDSTPDPELDTTWTTVLSDDQKVLLGSWAKEPIVGQITPMTLPSEYIE